MIFKGKSNENSNHSFFCLGDKNNLNAINVLFFHGLGGDSLGTWTNKNGNVWPHDLQNHPDSNTSIWLANYPTKRFGEGLGDGSMEVREHAESFLSSFEFYELYKKPFICICHSMGGLIVKKLLHICKERLSYDDHDLYENILNNCQAVFFIATPHLGSGVASCFKAFRLGSKETQQLAKNSDWLVDLKQAFMPLSDRYNIKVQSFYETNPVAGIGIIVDKISAASDCKGDVPQAIDADHFEIAKLDSIADDLGMKIANYLKQKTPMPKTKQMQVQKQVKPEKFIEGALINPFIHNVNINDIMKFIHEEAAIPAKYFYDTEQCAQSWCEFSSYTPLTSIEKFLKNERITETLNNWDQENGLSYVSIGPGDGRKDVKLLMAAKKNGLKKFHYIPLDVSVPLIKKATNQVCTLANRNIKIDTNFLLGDLESIQNAKEYLPKQKKIISVLGNTIGNLMYDDQVINRLHRVMEKGDVLFLEVRALEEKDRFMAENKECEEGEYIMKASAFSLGPLKTVGFDVSEGGFEIVEDLTNTYAHIDKTETAIVRFNLTDNDEGVDHVKLDKINFYHKASLDTFLTSGSLFDILHAETIGGDIFYFLEKCG